MFATSGETTSPKLKLLAKALMSVAIFNFLAFLAASAYLGGDALNGKVVDGHYFLSNHGRLTEVTAAVFTYSRWHGLSMFATHLLAMFAAWLWLRGSRLRTLSRWHMD